MGFKIRKDEKGIKIFHPAKIPTGKVDEYGNKKFKDIHKFYKVFNEQQVFEKEQVFDDANIVLLAA